MLSIQQLIKALRKLQNNTVAGGDLVKSIKHAAVCATETNTTIIPVGITLMTSLHNNDDKRDLKKAATSSLSVSELSEQDQQTNSNSSNCSSSSIYTSNDTSSQLPLKQQTQQTFHASHNKCFSLYSSLNVDSSNIQCNRETSIATTQDSVINKATVNNITFTTTSPLHQISCHLHSYYQQQPLRSQRIQKFFQQQIFHQFHTQPNQNLNTKQKQTQFAMSSLAAEPLRKQKSDSRNGKEDCHDTIDSESSSSATAPSSSSSSSSSASRPDTKQQNSSTGKPCFNTGLADILQFMELIGNLKVSNLFGLNRLSV